MPIAEALEHAYSKKLDLVEVSPMAEPPVCRVMDYGKYVFEQKKKENAAISKQQQIHVKVV